MTAHYVADQHLVESRGQFRREVPDLIGVRKKHQGRVHFANQLFQCGRVAIGGVLCQQLMIDRVHTCQFLPGQFARERVHRVPHYSRSHVLSHLLTGR